MHVLGGSYFERCEYPTWNEFFGSGGRAAIAARTFTTVRLHTCADAKAERNLNLLSDVYDVQVESIRIARSVRFRYFHSLSTPDIDYLSRGARPLIEVRGKAILRFGMVEAETVALGDRVVYDPQSGDLSRPFEENGSTAGELAIVANEPEVRALSGAKTTERAAKALLAGGASVVVIKCGLFGALVCTEKTRHAVPAYRTPKVFKIGSGDVFSGVFAAHWAARHVSATRAAEIASKAVAHYCASPVFPLTKDVGQSRIFPAARPAKTRKKPPSVYLAGPFFTLPQRWMVEEARSALLEMGVNVFSPLHDVGFGKPAKVAHADLKAVDRTDIMFALLDGLDSGTLFEIGYARSRGIPVVAYLDNEKEGALVMLEGSRCELYSDFATAIYQTAWKAYRA